MKLKIFEIILPNIFLVVLAVFLLSCSSKTEQNEYYFNVDCIEDIIAYKIDNDAYIYEIEYLDPDGLHIYNDSTDELESVYLYTENLKIFIDFLYDYNDYIENKISSLEIGRKYCIEYINNTYYLKITNN